jgi:hypothetical protein
MGKDVDQPRSLAKSVTVESSKVARVDLRNLPLDFCIRQHLVRGTSALVKPASIKAFSMASRGGTRSPIVGIDIIIIRGYIDFSTRNNVQKI